MATKKTTRRSTVKPKRSAVRSTPKAKAAPKRSPARRPGAAESALAAVGRRADDAGERVGALATRGSRAASSALESVRQGAGDTLVRAKKGWNELDGKGKAGVVAGGLAALAAAVAVPLAAKRSGRKKK